VSTPIVVGQYSLTVWQQLCETEARDHGMAGTYVPFVARTTSTARALLAVSATGWFRPDNVEIAADKFFDAFLAPINVQADGTYVTRASVSPSVFSGAATFDEPATVSSSCDNWTDKYYGTSHSTGDPERSSRSSFTGNTYSNCLVSHRVYCFQKPSGIMPLP
jgi:hypothetical protein